MISVLLKSVLFLINFLLPLIMESGRVNEVQQDLTAPGIQNLGGSGQVSGIDYNHPLFLSPSDETLVAFRSSLSN